LRNPQVLERLRIAINADDDAYLDAVVKEALRLTPVVLEVGRTLTRDTPVGAVTIPAGCSASPSILLAQRRAETYTNPLKFRPERFVDQPADPHTWLPFGGGVRRCIGAAFALLEIKTVLRTIVSSVELEAVGPMDKPRRRAVTMIPSHGTRVRIPISGATTSPSPTGQMRACHGERCQSQPRLPEPAR
jgi:cytochrome P450